MKPASDWGDDRAAGADASFRFSNQDPHGGNGAGLATADYDRAVESPDRTGPSSGRHARRGRPHDEQAGLGRRTVPRPPGAPRRVPGEPPPRAQPRRVVPSAYQQPPTAEPRPYDPPPFDAPPFDAPPYDPGPYDPDGFEPRQGFQAPPYPPRGYQPPACRPPSSPPLTRPPVYEEPGYGARRPPSRGRRRPAGRAPGCSTCGRRRRADLSRPVKRRHGGRNPSFPADRLRPHPGAERCPRGRRHRRGLQPVGHAAQRRLQPRPGRHPHERHRAVDCDCVPA